MLVRTTLLAAALAGAAFAAGAPAVAQNAEIRSDFCRKAWNDLASKQKPRALALSRDGQFCHSVWGAPNQRSADQQALTGCARSGQACRVVRR